MNAFEKEPTEVFFNIDFGYNRQRANVAKLRSAYLLMFKYFGYEYILHESLKDVRRQIQSPDQDILASKASIALNGIPEDLHNVCLLRSPSELRSFIVSFKVSTSIDRSFSVVLPGLSKDDKSIYERWAARGETLKDKQMDVATILFDLNAPLEYIYEGAVTSAWNSLNATHI